MRLALHRYQFDWKLTLLVLLLLPVLLRLGFWQLSREAEKRELQALYEQRLGSVPVSIENLNPQADLQYQPVLLQGSFDNERYFLLDNRIHRGRVGFEAIVPFVTRQGLLVFVNRGWLPSTGDRTRLPVVDPAPGELRLEGNVYVPLGEALVLGESRPGTTWPKLIQEADSAAALAAQWDASTGVAVFPWTVRLAEGSPAVLERNWTVVNTGPEKHRGYAVQWFAMALALVLLYLYYSFVYREESSMRTTHDN